MHWSVCWPILDLDGLLTGVPSIQFFSLSFPGYVCSHSERPQSSAQRQTWPSIPRNYQIVSDCSWVSKLLYLGNNDPPLEICCKWLRQQESPVIIGADILSQPLVQIWTPWWEMVLQLILQNIMFLRTNFYHMGFNEDKAALVLAFRFCNQGSRIRELLTSFHPVGRGGISSVPYSFSWWPFLCRHFLSPLQLS